MNGVSISIGQYYHWVWVRIKSWCRLPNSLHVFYCLRQWRGITCVTRHYNSFCLTFWAHVLFFLLQKSKASQKNVFSSINLKATHHLLLHYCEDDRLFKKIQNYSPNSSYEYNDFYRHVCEHESTTVSKHNLARIQASMGPLSWVSTTSLTYPHEKR